MHTILETFISVAHNAPPLHTHTPPMMKLISKPVAHACMHTNTSKVPQAVYQSTFSQLFPSYKSFNFSTQKVFFFSLFLARLFGFHIHGSYICMMEYWYLEQHRDALFLPTSCSKTGCSAYSETAVQPELWMWHCAYCEWQARRHWVLYSWDAMQLCGY